jgi:hypothetical protein
MTTRRKALEEIRDVLTRSLAETEDPRDLTALARELRATWAELDGIPVADSQAPADEIARRREERRRQASGG